ncbi:nischarin-like [Manihot esculenta]|uniref:nischarin-like n=1 Tax=Manihot esculenta TaxID=3983 RepID=UPI001CC82640|nr:nischarin-like [Manihot esculenta]
MTRAGRKENLLYDPKIERTAKSLRKQVNLRNQASRASSSSPATSLESTIRSATAPANRTPTAPAAENPAPANSPIVAPATAEIAPEIEFRVAAENPAMSEQPAAREEAEIQAGNLPVQAPQPRERTLRELDMPAEDQAPLCITYPQLTTPFELKTGKEKWTAVVPRQKQ